jgi:hypothetical protein
LNFSDKAEAKIDSLVRGQSILPGILAAIFEKPVQMVSRFGPNLVQIWSRFGPDFAVQTIWTNFWKPPTGWLPKLVYRLDLGNLDFFRPDLAAACPEFGQNSSWRERVNMLWNQYVFLAPFSFSGPKYSTLPFALHPYLQWCKSVMP